MISALRVISKYDGYVPWLEALVKVSVLVVEGDLVCSLRKNRFVTMFRRIRLVQVKLQKLQGKDVRVRRIGKVRVKQKKEEGTDLTP